LIAGRDPDAAPIFSASGEPGEEVGHIDGRDAVLTKISRAEDTATGELIEDSLHFNVCDFQGRLLVEGVGTLQMGSDKQLMGAVGGRGVAQHTTCVCPSAREPVPDPLCEMKTRWKSRGALASTAAPHPPRRCSSRQTSAWSGYSLARGRPPKPTSAGPGAAFSWLRYTSATAGLLRGVPALSRVTRRTASTAPRCTWPDPEHSSFTEFCENGARAVAHEADSRQVDAGFFATHSVEALKDRTGHWLGQQGRLVEPMVLRPGSATMRHRVG